MIKKWYTENLQKFIDFVGEPTGTKVRDYLLVVIAIVYIAFGTIIVKFPENSILKIMGFTSSRWVVLVSGTMYIGGIFMLIMWIFLFNKICWINKSKSVTAEKCWLVLRGYLYLFYHLFILKMYFISFERNKATNCCNIYTRVFFSVISNIFCFLFNRDTYS